MAELTKENDLSPQSRTLYLKAISAAETKNHEFAINLLQAVLKDAPGFLPGRQLARKCAIALSDGPKKKGGLFGMKTGGLSTMKYANTAKKEPEAALLEIEKELAKDPYNAELNDLEYDIFMRLNMLDSAAFSLETVRRGHPENTKLLHKLAEHYLARSIPDKAADIYTEISKQDPTDSAAIKGAKDATARASMQKQKWDENTDIRELRKDAAGAVELEMASRAGLTRDQLEDKRDQLIAKYHEDQNNLQVVKELASVYERLEEWSLCYQFYEWAHQLSQGDVALRNKAAAMRDRALDSEIKQMAAAVEADPNNAELRQAYEAHRAQRIQSQVVEAQARVQENPTDPQLRFELGSALYAAGDLSGAIPHLQQAKTNPHIRTKVLLLLGRTFRAKGMFDLGIKQLSDALADLVGMDNTKKEVLYEKGLIHDDMGDKVSALDCFKQIYEVDYNYRDVAQRVESSYGG